MIYSENHCAKCFLHPTVTITKPRICPFPTSLQTVFTGTDWECNCAAKTALLPSLQMDRLGHGLDHSLPSYNRNLTVSDHAGFIVSEGITKAMNNPFHIRLAFHKSHKSAVNLQERTELCLEKRFFKNPWKMHVFYN